jgi:hypothetical protein
MQGDATEGIFFVFSCRVAMLGKADEIWLRGRIAFFRG